jgi:hypothetical protein
LNRPYEPLAAAVRLEAYDEALEHLLRLFPEAR